MPKLGIDQIFFLEAFGRDVDYHDAHPQSTYLDRETGDIIWVYNEDEDSKEIRRKPEKNSEIRKAVAANPARHLKIRGLSHGEQHSILQRFLDSEWTADEEDRTLARRAYIRSIGGWRKSAEDSAIVAFAFYREQKLSELAEVFLRLHDVEPEWH